jgi:hypothetical protein
VTALAAFAAAFLLAGLLVGGGWGTVLTVVSLLVNLGWLAVTFLRWWWQATVSHRRIMLATIGLYVVGWIAVRGAVGPFAAWALGLAGIGFFALMATVFVSTGYLAAHHAKRAQAAIAAIEAGRRQEITR